MATTEPTLLPCALCGCEAVRDRNFGRDARTCTGCGISIRGDMGQMSDELDAVWNRRPAASHAPMEGFLQAALEYADKVTAHCMDAEEAGECSPDEEDRCIMVLAHAVRAASSTGAQAEAGAVPACPDIQAMVDRFLAWRLPDDFSPDAGISFEREYNRNTPWPAKHEPIGTNLFSADQAEAMIRHILGPVPARPEVEGAP